MRERNGAEYIQDALNLLDDELILETDEIRRKSENIVLERGSDMAFLELEDRNKSKYKNKLSSWRRWTALAASICVFAIAGVVWSEVVLPNGDNAVEEGIVEKVESSTDGNEMKDNTTDAMDSDLDIDEVVREEALTQGNPIGKQNLNQGVESVVELEAFSGVEIPALEVALGKDDTVLGDMSAFFIYEGRCYVQSEYYADGTSFVGDYVGTAVGLIDEWTKEDGYVDYAGSVSGKFYEVKGYDPSFMLCMKYENGAVETFINNNGILLRKGSDLIENRLHLKDNYEQVAFKTQQAWNETLPDYKNILPKEYHEVMDRFLESFSADDFMYIKDTPLEMEWENHYTKDKDNFYLTFYTEEGLRFDFALYEDGYVRFHDFYDVCVQIDPNLYEEIIEILKDAS